MRESVLLVCVVALSCATPKETTAPNPVPEPVSPVLTKAPERAPIRLTLVGTNDVHGWVMTQEEQLEGGKLRFGGIATFAAYLQVLREDNPGGVVLVDAGDLFQGTLMSNITEGEVVIDAFNLLKYDAAAIGNHEFDYGPVGPVSAATDIAMDPFGALKARIAQAKFPLLSTNIYEADTGLRPSWLPGEGSIIIERRGVKVGIFGLTTPTTPTVTLPINVASLRFGALATEALTASRRLRERGADVVVAVVHAGGRCTDVSHAEDASSCDLDSGEVFEMMKGLPEGTLDAVVAGHTHAQIGHFIKGTPIIESWALGRYFGMIELYLDPQTKKVLPGKTQIHSGIEVCETEDQATSSCDVRRLKAQGNPVTPVIARFRGREITPDATVLATLKPAEQRVAELQEKDLHIKVPVPLGRNYESESALGSFLADSLRSMTKADVALLNPGGLRADLKAGAVKYGAVYEVLPFDNQVATLELTGDQLLRLLTAAYGSKKGVFQVSGLEVKLGRCPAPDRLKQATLPGGKPLDPAGKYTLVMPDFLARGGDGLAPVLATIEPARVNLGETRAANLRDELVAYWQTAKTPFRAPRPGRIAFTEVAAKCKASDEAGSP
ncbi:MAG: 5'-nucleotidase C-terminal domain-containing protein [Myxococcota bacterium]